MLCFPEPHCKQRILMEKIFRVLKFLLELFPLRFFPALINALKAGIGVKREPLRQVCSICLGGVARPSFTDTCRHEFCFECLQAWSQANRHCPLCRVEYKKIIYEKKSDTEFKSIPVSAQSYARSEEAMIDEERDDDDDIDDEYVSTVLDHLQVTKETHEKNLLDFCSCLYASLLDQDFQALDKLLQQTISEVGVNLESNYGTDGMINLKTLRYHLRQSTYLRIQSEEEFTAYLDEMTGEPDEGNEDELEELGRSTMRNFAQEVWIQNTLRQYEVKDILAKALSQRNAPLFCSVIHHAMCSYHRTLLELDSTSTTRLILWHAMKELQIILDNPLASENLENISHFLISLISDKDLQLILVH